MKIETKFGLGEIVAKEIYKGNELLIDALMEVVTVCVSKAGISYLCRMPQTMQLIHFEEHELIGDPDYCQETASYPVEKDDV